MEKQLGLRKQFANMSASEKAEMRKRRMESGKQIHLQNVQAREQYEQAFEAEVYQKRITSFQETGMTIEEATAHVDELYALENAKWEKRHMKKITTAHVHPTE
jgi:hypothetical protein